MKNEDTSKAFVFHLIVIFAFDGGILFDTIHVVDFALNVMRMNSFFFFFLMLLLITQLFLHF